ncbi:MAG: hypothetical protein A2898_02200 [Candidatus Kerfeldbacteria bacterium RIFCSPLOWO2_01_FULL_48_11]|uniref:Response regulatory domain-containing protein n=1 Tax=Candidatus Kerfeldbacteria bacterium RIFCSPLOWO2_01_FULL_48_11 TaxID=1798543 RepID=A0A1G2B1U5_9BACT|nr:MAG: hypothetical protein A2898_02200 [Candidatus Kerfeldbacteria bacterium RIFCSPLOWO2_01_FULL_48_11]
MSDKKKVLIVEDERPLLEVLTDKFELEGFKVHTATDGEAGLKEAIQHHPDIILLDIVMPKMDGLTMLNELRKNVWGKTANVIMLTNLSDWKSTDKAIIQDVHEYMVKSDWKIEDVVKKVKSKLHVS